MALTPIHTAAFTLTAATITPDVAWVLHGCAGPLPDNLPGLVAAGLIAGAHWVYNRWLAPEEASAAAAPSTPSEPLAAR